MEFIVSFKNPEKVIKEDDLKHCNVWVMDFSKQIRTPIQPEKDTTILPENHEIDINQQDKVNLFNNFSLERPSVIPTAIEPVVETSEEPVSETPEEPVVETPDEPVVETPEEPVVETPDEPVVETQEEPVVETQAEPVVESKEEPVVETPVEISESVVEKPQETISIDKCPINVFITFMKTEISVYDEKINKIKTVRDMITSNLDVDDDIRPCIETFSKQIEELNNNKSLFIEKVKKSILPLF